MFGKIAAVGAKSIQNLIGKYGPEPINTVLTAEKFHEIIKSKKTNIKNVLLDQTVVSGLGNIYATDALFLAGINPGTNTANITLEKSKKLMEACREILLEGIKNRGSTLPDKAYVDIFGKEGKQQNFFRIYMKEKCPVCNSKVTFTKLNGRGTYYCTVCQPPNNQNLLFK
jgi:formamidopyrimidine-DNA glycosylase